MARAPFVDGGGSGIAMLNSLTRGAIIVVALLHLGFMALEATKWSTPLGQRLTHLSEGAARETAGVGVNLGLYNGFLGLALLWATFALGRREAYSVQWLLLTFITIAGIVGAVSIKNSGIFVLQSLPALAALVLIWVDRPYPRTEDQAIREIIKIERQILAIKSVDAQPKPRTAEGAVLRGQHPKLHGLVRAKFIVANDLPEGMRVGIFKEPGKPYDALIRFSNARNSDDQDRGGHGMAIKLLNVPAGNESHTSTQDIVLFDAPIFFIGNPIQYVEFEEATLRAYGKSKPGSLATTFLNYYWRHPRQFLNLLKTQRGDVTDPLAIRYWSVTPYQFGTVAVKYSAKPVADGEAPIVVPREEHAPRGHEGAPWSTRHGVRVPGPDPGRPRVDAGRGSDDGMGRSCVATPDGGLDPDSGAQEFATPEQDLFAEHLSFTPWNALPEHAPLGGINRARKAVYESLSEFRHALNHVPRQEPTGSPMAE